MRAVLLLLLSVGMAASTEDLLVFDETGALKENEMDPVEKVERIVDSSLRSRTGNGEDMRVSHNTRVESGDGAYMRDTLVQEGTYQYTSPEGIPIFVHWIADDMGFRLVPPPAPVALVRNHRLMSSKRVIDGVVEKVDKAPIVKSDPLPLVQVNAEYGVASTKVGHGYGEPFAGDRVSFLKMGSAFNTRINPETHYDNGVIVPVRDLY